MVIFELTELKKKEAKKSKAAKEEKSHPTPEETPAVEKKPAAEQKKETKVVIKENPVDAKKPQKKFMGGLRQIFKKKSDSL
jgi:hypothetical protein